MRNIAAGEELNYDYGLIIDERYTPFPARRPKYRLLVWQPPTAVAPAGTKRAGSSGRRRMPDNPVQARTSWHGSWRTCGGRS